jgi:hypothetical protein
LETDTAEENIHAVYALAKYKGVIGGNSKTNNNNFQAVFKKET